MRTLKLQVQMSIDGFIAGPNGEMNWLNFNWTDDIKQYVTALTDPIDTILLGKNLAKGFIPHWAGVAKDSNNPEQSAGKKYTETHKVVFSKTLTTSEWENTDIATGDLAAEVNALKGQKGGDMIAYGGGQFVSSLIQAKLIDELHLFLNPAVLGKGMPIFQDIREPQNFQLMTSQQFECGIIVLVYKPK